ncbi:MAG: S8 family serine peptidase, partial [Candidatus Neomarinimicrobiota bacterium]
AGVAAAVTNNYLGIAGASWNAQLMPVNTTCESDSFICYGYEGIIYAAENGADIINASWGSTYIGLTPFEERRLLQLMRNITDYVVECGALLVSSAGNDNINNDEVLSLPADAPHVLSVGATGKSSDTKASFSNYGASVGVFAPGMFLNTTVPGDGYIANASGTSFSSALATGTAALVKTRFPDLSPDQLAQQVRVTADPIDDVNDIRLRGLMGKGRINAYRSVMDTTIPAIRIAGTSFRESGTDGIIENGDIVDVTVTLTNYLASASDITVALVRYDPNITVTQGEAVISSLPSGNTAAVDFQFTVGQVGEEYPLRFTLEISTGSYQDRDLFTLYANEPLVLSHDTGPLRVSITAEGNIGWTGFADMSPGEGFVYNGTNLLFEGGLLVGVTKTRVSDCIRGVNEELEQDFEMPPGEQLVIVSGQVANEEGTVVLTDNLASSPISVTVRQESYADNDPDYDDFVIFRYTITNTSSRVLTSLYSGLFFDWDINENARDYACFDAARSMGNVQNYATNPTFLAATRLLTRHADLMYRAIENPTEIYGGQSGDGFTELEKWAYLSGGIQRTNLDAVDVSTLTAAGPFVAEPGQSVEVAFAVVGAGSSAQLEENADNAQEFWDTVIQPARSNHPPVFTRVIPDTSISSVETLVFTYAADDIDGDDLTFSLVNPPANTTLDSETGRLTFQPAADFGGSTIITTVVSDGVFASATSARITIEEVVYFLGQNYSNPFRLSVEGVTTIEYQLAEPGKVRLVIYDLLGREVKALVSDSQPRAAGEYRVIWNA